MIAEGQTLDNHKPPYLPKLNSAVIGCFPYPKLVVTTIGTLHAVGNNDGTLTVRWYYLRANLED